MDRLKAAKVFVDVAQSGSFTKTADRLGISRPMVTRYVETMEEWLQIRLLHRTTRKVTLTTAGQNCLHTVEKWLNDGESLKDLTRVEDKLMGRIKVATSMSFGFSQLVPAVKLFMQDHSEVVVDISVEDTVIDLVEQQIDLAIRISSNPDHSLIGKPIGTCESVLVASPQYLQARPNILYPSDLLNHDCLGYKYFEQNVWHLSGDSGHESIEVKPRLTANEATVLLHAVKCGMGISLQPTYLVADDIRSGVLAHVLPSWKPKDLQIYVLYSSRKHLSPTLRAFIDFLSEHFASKRW